MAESLAYVDPPAPVAHEIGFRKISGVQPSAHHLAKRHRQQRTQHGRHRIQPQVLEISTHHRRCQRTRLRPFNGNHTDAVVDGEQGAAGFVGGKMDASTVEASGRDGH